MSYFRIRTMFSLTLCLLFQATVFAACWVIEPKACNEPDESCDTHECVDDGLPFNICATVRGTFSNLGSYKDARAAATQTEVNEGGTEVGPNYDSYIYCVQAIPCNYMEPCDPNYCEDDGIRGGYGSPTFDDEFTPNSESCPGAM